jgi:16S rRNA (cytosine1402-N4)-methyltransferase
VAERLTTGRLIACDRDGESLELARRRLDAWKDRIVFRKAAFSELEEALAQVEVARVDGMIADLGPSYYQMTDPERGFGLNADGP